MVLPGHMLDATKLMFVRDVSIGSHNLVGYFSMKPGSRLARHQINNLLIMITPKP